MAFLERRRRHALAVAGAATAAAGAFALWRAARGDRPPTHMDPAKRDPGAALRTTVSG